MSQPIVLHTDPSKTERDCDCACDQAIQPNTAAVAQFDAEAMLPCPFCGEVELLEVRHDYQDYQYWVACPQHSGSVYGPSARSRDRAIAAWNRRSAQ